MRTIMLARKPLAGSILETTINFETSPINIDRSRVAGTKPVFHRWLGSKNERYAPSEQETVIEDDGKGRWPANFFLESSLAVQDLDDQSGIRPVSGAAKTGFVSTQICTNRSTAIMTGTIGNGLMHNDSGYASRYFKQFHRIRYNENYYARKETIG